MDSINLSPCTHRKDSDFYVEALLVLKDFTSKQFIDIVFVVLREQAASLKYYSSLATIILGAWGFLLFGSSPLSKKLLPPFADHQSYYFWAAISIALAAGVFFASVNFMAIKVSKLPVVNDIAIELKKLAQAEENNELEPAYQMLIQNILLAIQNMQKEATKLIRFYDIANKTLGVALLCSIFFFGIALSNIAYTGGLYGT